MSQYQLSTSIAKVFGIVFLRQADGTRVYSKYYLKHFPSNVLRIQEGSLDKIDIQKEFEKHIWEKGKRVGAKLARGSETEIFQLGHFNILMKAFNEINLYVIGDFEENEVLLYQVITAVYESLQHITKDHISKKTLLDQFEQLIIVLDEITDEVIIARATMQDCNGVNVQQTESTFSSVFAQAKKSFASSFMGN